MNARSDADASPQTRSSREAGSTPCASQGAKRIGSALAMGWINEAPQGASGCVTHGVIGKRFAAAAVEGSRRRVR